MAHRKRCVKCKANRRFSDFEPRDNPICVKCSPPNGARQVPRNKVRQQQVPIYAGTNGNSQHHAEVLPVVSARSGSQVAINPIPSNAPTPPRSITVRAKFCPGCGEKPWYQFFRDNTSDDGLSEKCKVCTQKESDSVATDNPSEVSIEEETFPCAYHSKRAGYEVRHPRSSFGPGKTKDGIQSWCRKAFQEYKANRRQQRKAATQVMAEVFDAALDRAAQEGAGVESVEPNTELITPSVELIVPEPPKTEAAAVRFESRSVTITPAFVRGGKRIYNVSNIAYIEETDAQDVLNVVLNIHDINKDGIQYPRSFEVSGEDAYQVRMALMTMMGDDEQLQRLAMLVRKVEDAARNEATALELAAATERSAESMKRRLDTKDKEIEALRRQVEELATAKKLAEDRAGQALATLAQLQNLLGGAKLTS